MAGRITDDDLMFGELPDEDGDNLNGTAEESEIDANNDETFGGNAILGSSDELEDYAAQTAGLRLDDAWGPPSCSTAPDASELPLPTFDFSNFGNTSFDLLGTDSMRLESIWSAPSDGFGGWPKAQITDRISSPIEEKETLIPSSSAGVIGSAVRHKPTIPPMPKGPTLEELEGAHVAPVRVEEPRIPTLPPAAMSAEELEKQMLEEAKQKSKVDAPSNGAANMPPLPLMAGAVPPGYPPPGNAPIIPPIPPMFLPCFPVWLDLLTGRIPYLPPGCPPVPAFVVHLLKHVQDPRMVMALLQSAVTPPIPMPPMGPPPQMPPPMTPNHGYHRKPPGMPSGKTIEDLAFDQFAGFMSRKERQWLVKIQILQCQGTNNPYEDDYYYLSWRQKRLDEGYNAPAKELQKSETKEILNELKNRRRERNGSTSEPPRDRETCLVSKFASSLGLPSKSSTSNPRHLIRVQASDSPDDDSEKKMANSQKKLRTLLLRLEAATLLLIECGDRHIAMQSAGQNREQLCREISERVNMVLRDLFTDDFAKLLQVSKGRALIARLLKVVLPPDMCRVISILVAQARANPAKIYAELAEDVLPALYTSLMAIGRENVLRIVCHLNVAEILQGLNEKNLFVRDVLYTILLVCSIKKTAPNCQLFMWLKSTNNIDMSAGWSSNVVNLSDLLPVDGEAITTLASWLHLLVSECSYGTIASQLASRLPTR